MIARVDSFVLRGIDAIVCEVEADLNPVGLPKTTIVGLPDAAVKESVERVRTALLNCGYRFPQQRLTVNLAPADVRKEGPVYDLPIAVALLAADGTINGEGGAEGAPGPGPGSGARSGAGSFMVAGELALDGRVRPVRGVISLAMLARRLGRRGILVPRDNASEASAVEGVEVYGVDSIGTVVSLLNGAADLAPVAPFDADAALQRASAEIDFGDVRGQESAKRALAVAATGAHNVFMLGPAGTGKTMMARALPGVLPPLTRDEALEVTRVHSCAGTLRDDQPLILQRPVRTPHHSASAPAIIGGGSIPRPGDVSLAHRGVLFLDEVPEFSRTVLETLRQPLEDGVVTIARAYGSIRFPARFMLVGALNPTPGGDMPGDAASQRRMDRYLDRLSGPLIDRVDIHIEVPAVSFRELRSPRRGTTTETIRTRVGGARARQRARQGAVVNGELRHEALDRHAMLDDAGLQLVEQAMSELGLSARAYDKIRRVARSVADLEGADRIETHHVAEAVHYRQLDRRR